MSRAVGRHVTVEEWHGFVDRLRAADVEWIIEPTLRFADDSQVFARGPVSGD